MPRRDIVVVGASAGGIAALQKLVGGIAADYQGSIFIVLHLSPHSPNVLPHILSRASHLPVANAVDGEAISRGRIYVAPPNHHLLLAPGVIHLGHGPKENRFRPAIDPLFRSAALAFGERAAGVILTGALDDGTAGLCAIKGARGLTIVQNPDEAEVPSMPRSALRHVNVDYCLRVAEIATLLPQLATERPVSEEPIRAVIPMSDELRNEVRIAEDETSAVSLAHLGEPSMYTCPECHGSLLRVRNSVPVRFRCHTGHAYTAVSLDDELREKVEQTTWTAIRSFQEHALLLNAMAEEAGIPEDIAADFRSRAEDSLRRAGVVREALTDGHKSNEH